MRSLTQEIREALKEADSELAAAYSCDPVLNDKLLEVFTSVAESAAERWWERGRQQAISNMMANARAARES